MRHLAVIVALVLAGCGADGAPERPETGISISGEARFGIERRL